MKKIIASLLLTFFAAGFLVAQNRDNIEKFRAQASRILTMIEKNPKNADKFYNQVDLAEALVTMYELNTSKLTFNVKPSDLERIYPGVKPESVDEKQEGTEKVAIYTYPYIQLKFINDQLRTWELRNLDIDNILNKALEAVNKAGELDKRNDSEATKKLDSYRTSLRHAFNMNAFAAYFAKDYRSAYDNAMIYLNLMDKARLRDTTAQIYAVYYAQYGGMKDELLKAYDQAVSRKYRETKSNEGQMFLFAYQVYLERGDSLKALATLTKGAEFYPDNYDIIIKLINMYRDLNQKDQAVAYLHKAQTMNPGFAVLYLVEASLQHDLGNDSLSYILYKKVLELDDKNFRAYLNIGATEFDKGKAMILKAQEEENNDVYVARKKEAEDQMNVAVPYLEKAAELNPDPSNTEILATLKSLYYLLRVRFPEYDARYKVLEQKLPTPKTN